MKPVKQNIKFVDIKASAKCQARVEISKEAAAEYGEIAKASKAKGADFPFHGGTVFKDEAGNLWLADGFHRRSAARSSGYESAEFNVFEGTENDAFLFACKANNEHGVRLTKADRIHNLMRVLELPGAKEMPNTEIAGLIGQSEFFVRQHRPVSKTEAVKKVSRGGKKVEVNTSKIGGKGGKTAAPKKAPAAKKGKAGTAPETPAAPVPKKDTKLEEALTRLSAIFQSEKVSNAILDGSLQLTPKEVKEWAAMSEAFIKKTESLVVDKRWKPSRAIKFLEETVNAGMTFSEASLLVILTGAASVTIDGVLWTGEMVVEA